MNIKGNIMWIGICGLLVVVLLILGAVYLNQVNEVNSLTNQVSSANDEIDDLTSQLMNSEALLTASEEFLQAYFSGWGTFYDANDVEDIAWSNYNKAENYYDLGNWYSGVGYFSESSTYFMTARINYQDALEWFQTAENSSDDSVWINISQYCVSMMDTKMKAMTFIREASDRMQDTCDAYLDGNYQAAHTYYDDALLKYGYYEDQMNVFDNYQETFAMVLKNYIS